MRKRDEQYGNGKSKMTVMMFQLEGADDTLQEGIRTISQAMGNVLGASRMIITKTPVALPAPEGDVSSGNAEHSNTPSDITENSVSETPERPRSNGSKSRNPRILQLDLKGGKIPLKDFCEQKAVGDNDNRRYLVIAFWLKENLNIPAVTMDHIHTCYRTLGWQTPSDASRPLRSMKANGWFDKGAEKGSYAINHVGENQVLGA